jgi:hypothetical protein
MVRTMIETGKERNPDGLKSFSFSGKGWKIQMNLPGGE